QVAELRLVAVECDQLVAQEAVDVGVEAIAVERTLARPTREVVGQSAGLRLAAPVQAVEQDLELRIAQDRHGRLVRPPRAAARKGRALPASTRRCAGLQRELSASRRRYAFDAAARQRRGRVRRAASAPAPRDPGAPAWYAARMPARHPRLDERLVRDGLAETRAKAQALVMAGSVLVDGAVVDKPGTRVRPDAAVALRAAASPYVSRGGEKLAGALDDLGID